MTVVAVTGARGPLGAALCALLGADERVDRIVGIDVSEPHMPVSKLEFRVADVRDPVLSQAVEDADVVVHLATWVDQPVSEDLHFALVVQGTRNVLAAADKVGARSVIHLSSAMVYGAHPQNDVPLDEDAPRQVAPDAVRPYHLLLAEELTAAFAEEHPDARVATLRPVTVLGRRVDSPATRLLEAPRIPMVAGYEPTFQVVDVEDVARALHLAAIGDLEGSYNVAAEGWVTTKEALALLGRRPLRIPEAPLMGMLEAARRAGWTDFGPGQMAYLMHPWVVSTTRLRGAGWRAERSHREVLRSHADEHAAYLRLGRLRLRRRDLYGGAVVAGGLAGASVLRAARRYQQRER